MDNEGRIVAVGGRNSMGFSFVIVMVMLWCGGVLGNETSGGLWQTVRTRAEKSNNPKALWRELKALPPEELLQCGEDFSRESEQFGAAPESVIITINAILSYHKDKVGWQETAEAVGRIVAKSENPYWVYGALEWIENNDHWRNIPSKGFRAIAEGMLIALRRRGTSKTLGVVLKKCASEDIVGNFSAEDRRYLGEACEIILQVGDKSEQEQAERVLQFLKRMAKSRAEFAQ